MSLQLPRSLADLRSRPGQAQDHLESDGVFTLRTVRGADWKTFMISVGKQSFTFPQ